MFVHWAGRLADLREIHAIATKHGIPVVEDAAHALGAVYDGVKIGAHSDFVCFSFQAIKHLSTADGGAIVCKRAEDSERIRRFVGLVWIVHGRILNAGVRISPRGGISIT